MVLTGQMARNPYSGVTSNGGVIYGVTWYGGAGNAGTVFKLDASGKLTQLYAFPDSTIGCNPLAAPHRCRPRIVWHDDVLWGRGGRHGFRPRSRQWPGVIAVQLCSEPKWLRIAK